MKTGTLGKEYMDGEIIIHQGEVGNCMYVIQEGQVEVIMEVGANRIQLAVRNQYDFFGEMALFEKEVRMATVRAIGRTRVLAVDKKSFLRRIHEDPSLAYRLVQSMSARIRELSTEVGQLQVRLGQEQSKSERRL
jgi:CRP/FNR family transcriptional regulator, cyclic AMP receptor protein